MISLIYGKKKTHREQNVCHICKKGFSFDYDNENVWEKTEKSI